MAERYRKVDPRFWTDEKIRRLPSEEKEVAIYCFTSPQMNRIGICLFSPGAAAEHTGMLPQTFRERFDRVLANMGWKFDESCGVIYLPTWWKYNQPENPNVLKSNLEDIHDLPQTLLLAEFAANTAHLRQTLHATFRERLAERYGKRWGERMPHQEQEQEQDITHTGEAPKSEAEEPPKGGTTNDVRASLAAEAGGEAAAAKLVAEFADRDDPESYALQVLRNRKLNAAKPKPTAATRPAVSQASERVAWINAHADEARKIFGEVTAGWAAERVAAAKRAPERCGEFCQAVDRAMGKGVMK